MSISWNFTNDTVTGADVTWTPTESKVYNIRITAGATTGTFTTPTTTASTQRTDTVTLAATEANTVTTAKAVIY